MDTIEFKFKDSIIDYNRIKTVIILINGLDIIEKLKIYELPLAKKENAEQIAGGYDGLTPDELYTYLIDQNEIDKPENKVTILGCHCGVIGCWPIEINIIKESNKIIWTNFEQPHRSIDSHNFWDYTDFGNFEFEIDNYYNELENLKLEADFKNDISINKTNNFIEKLNVFFKNMIS